MDVSELEKCLNEQKLSYEKRNAESFLVASKKFGKRYPVQALLSIRDERICAELHSIRIRCSEDIYQDRFLVFD